MMKKLLSILLILAMVLALPGVAFADFDLNTIPTPKLIVVDADDPTQVFYERSCDEQAYPASTTKIMTCILALEHLSLDQEITVGEEIEGHYELSAGYSSKSSLMGLEIGETLTLRDLLYGLMMVSGNDAADAIAVAVSGSVKSFVNLMNDKAASLGMTNTHFVNPNGVQNENHYTTARDIATLTAYALKNNDFRTIVGSSSYTVPANNKHPEPRVKNNTNKLLYTGENDTESCLYPYAIGVKTGDTPRAGKCLVAAAQKDGATVIIVLYNDAPDATYSRFHNAANLFESVFQDKYVLISGQDMNVQTQFHATIAQGQPEDLDENGQLTLTADVSGLNFRVLPSKAGMYSSGQMNIVPEVTWTHELTAPIAAGTLLGTVSYKLDGKEIYRTTLTTPSTVRETAIIQTAEIVDDNGKPTTGGNSLLLSPTAAPKPVKSDSNGIKIVIGILVAVIVLLVVLVIAALVIRKKRKEAARRRRRQQRLAQQRRMQQAGQAPRSNAPRQGSTTRRPQEHGTGARASYRTTNRNR